MQTGGRSDATNKFETDIPTTIYTVVKPPTFQEK